MELTGSRVLLTGASGGLGQAIARRLGRYGAQLTLTARNRPALDSLADETRGTVVEADLSKRSDVQRLAKMVSEFDVVIANAGVGGEASGSELSVKAIDGAIDVNLRAPMVLSGAFAQACIAAGRPGQLVLIGSLSGIAPTPDTCLYNATKFGLRGFGLSLRQDLEEYGIGVTVVEPGFIRDAGMFANNDVELPRGVRTKSPVDVAQAVEKAIRTNPAEIFVAPTELRAVATLATVAPGLSEVIQRRVGTKEMRNGNG
ncbi:MAG: SDR family NAD(P)-dependent oxidoreductase [Candidatus Microthrix sp.]|nr:SDR family NAD(P)-dependent oxidoreductase [Candidatus Microthrix sp.]